MLWCLSHSAVDHQALASSHLLGLLDLFLLLEKKSCLKALQLKGLLPVSMWEVRFVKMKRGCTLHEVVWRWQVKYLCALV